MKKKIVSLALVAALVAIVAAGSLAYFTDEQKVTNTFSFSKNVEITLDETDITDPDLKKRTEEGNEYKDIYPGQTVVKDPTIHNGKESAACYVRAFITINNKEALDAIFAPNGIALDKVLTGQGTNWKYIGFEEVDDTRVYELQYEVALEAGKDTTPVFKNVVFPTTLTETQIGTIEDLSIVVTGEAVQAAGFATYDKAWETIDKEKASK